MRNAFYDVSFTSISSECLERARADAADARSAIFSYISVTHVSAVSLLRLTTRLQLLAVS